MELCCQTCPGLKASLLTSLLRARITAFDWLQIERNHKKTLERQVEHMERFRTNSQVLSNIKQFGLWILTMVDVGVLSLRVLGESDLSGLNL